VTKKSHQNIQRIERNFFGNLWKKIFAAHQNWPARRRRHSDVGAQLYW